MVYQIKKYDGTTVATISDYQYNDTAVPLVLFGKGVTEYGKPMAENLLHLLENFAGVTPPGLPARLGNPVTGQLWYDTANRKIKVRSTTNTWDVVGSANVGPMPPVPPNMGDMWLDTSASPARMRVWNGTSWQLVAGAAAASSSIANSSTGNGSSSEGNYFTNTAAGENAAPQIGDLWFDPAVARLKVFNGTKWQFTTSASTGFINPSLPSNPSNTPTDDSSFLGGVNAGQYHTSPTLGPSQGMFSTGDLLWDNVTNQLFAMTDHSTELVGPIGVYKFTANDTPRGYTNHFHFSSGDQVSPGTKDFMGIVANNELMGVWSAFNSVYSDLPATWSQTHGKLTVPIAIREKFSGDSREYDAFITPGLSLVVPVTVKKGNLRVGDGDGSAQLELSNEAPTTVTKSIIATRYSNDDATSSNIALVRYRGDRRAPLAVQNGDSLGAIEFSALCGEAVKAGVSITAKMNGNLDVPAQRVPAKLSILTNYVERMYVTQSALGCNVNLETIGGTGNVAGVNTAMEYPSHTFIDNVGTGMSSPNGGDTLNLALKHRLLLQLVYDGPSVLYGNWLTTGNHTVNGTLTAANGVFGTLSAGSFSTSGGSVGMDAFIRNDASTGGAASRNPAIGATTEGLGGLNFGTSSQRWGIFYGVANSSFYGDLAERYESDTEYDEGTVVKLGGTHEITQTVKAEDDNVFGVISIRPGVAMNDGVGDNSTHPYVAFSGRLPCKVIGPIEKGQRLISSDIPGVAMGVKDLPRVSPYSIIGRSLEESMDNDIRLIEIVVGKN